MIYLELKMKHFVFLDVDQTLLYNTDDLNQELLTSLRGQGVTDIYLFTNMDLTDLRTVGLGVGLARHEIIQWIKEQGFTVHDVITPADTGNYDDHGQLKRIGTAYTELYSNLMMRIQQNGSLDLQRYNSNPEDLADYFINNNQWLMASSITRHKINNLPINDISIPTLRVCLVDSRNGAFVKWLDRDSLIEFFNSDAEAKQQFRIDHQEDPLNTIQFKGGMSSNNKALMMQLAAGELIKQHGPIVISFFDDEEKHLLHSKELMEGYERSGLLQLNTCHMPADFETSQSDDAKQAYQATLAQSIIAQRNEIVLESSLRVLDGWIKTKQQRTQAISQVREQMAFATSSQMLKIANMAHMGYGVFSEVSLKTAYKCLIIAYLKAKNHEELNDTKMAILGFLNKYGIEHINSDRVTDEQVGSIFDLLTNIPHHESKVSPAAKMLLNRLISLQLLKLSSFNELDSPGFQDEIGTLSWLRETKATAEQSQLIRISQSAPGAPESTLPVENNYAGTSSSEASSSCRTEPSSSSLARAMQPNGDARSRLSRGISFFGSKVDEAESAGLTASLGSPSA